MYVNFLLRSKVTPPYIKVSALFCEAAFNQGRVALDWMTKLEEGSEMQGYTAQGIKCWTGNDDEAFESRHSAGAVGAVSVASNLIPGTFAVFGLCFWG